MGGYNGILLQKETYTQEAYQPVLAGRFAIKLVTANEPKPNLPVLTLLAGCTLHNYLKKNISGMRQFFVDTLPVCTCNPLVTINLTCDTEVSLFRFVL